MASAAPHVERVTSLDDPRVAVYRNVKDADLARDGRRFIADGELVVRRLLASDYAAESVLVADRRADLIVPLVPAETPVYVAPADVVDAIVGFRFHSGVMACGRRRTPLALADVAPRWPEGPVTLVVLPETTSTQNLGAILRISAAMGADAVLLGPHTCDPFYRQSVRVSMGEVFRLTLIESADLESDLRQLHGRWGVELAAAVLEDGAESLATAARPPRLAILFGNEAQGLGADMLALCRRRITIPMKLGTDSLNVAVSAALFLFHFTSEAAQPGQE
jgi:tRNA G18 (ribose-2'-O)-methylase SpoU